MQNIFREVKQEIEFYRTSQLNFPTHIHEDIELVYIHRGGGTAYCDGKRYTLSDRSFFLTFPNQSHYYTDFEEGQYVLLILKPSQLLNGYEVFMKGCPRSSLWTVPQNEDDPTLTLFRIALEEYEQRGYTTVVEACLTAFFEILLRFYTIEKRRESGDTVLRILQYCADHFKEEITVSDVAKHLQISVSTVSHVFGSRIAVSFCDHIHSLRLNEAVHLLGGNTHSITEISMVAGFPSIRTFNRVFRRQYGVSPSEYRKQCQQREKSPRTV